MTEASEKELDKLTGYLINRKKKRPSRANETEEQKAVGVSYVLVRMKITRGGLK